MIGSPDLLAFTGAEGFGEGEGEDEAQALPEELSVPLLPPGHPWSSSAQFPRDFILVAEFSEQVGPKPVLTIPDDPKVVGSFDLNHFSVRLMSVDYQASGPAPGPPASPGPRLHFSEDSRVILGDSAEDAFAYVHHMTLYDLEARGMVRPFCVAYVSSDQTKLMENVGELSTCFSQASDSLKTGNRQAFSLELQRKLQELELTRLALQRGGEPRGEDDGVTAGGREELEALEHVICNHRELLRQVTSYPNRKLKQPDFLPYDTADSPADPLLLPEPSRSPSAPAPASWRAGHRLKPLHELCNSYFLSLMKEQLADAELRLRGDRSVLRCARLASALSGRLGLVNFLFELCPEDGGEAEGAEAGLQGEAGLRSAAELLLLQPDPPSLESFLSCVEEIPIKLEAAEGATGTPVAMEMTGSASSGDSIEVLGTERSYRLQRGVATATSREAPAGATDASHRRPQVDGAIRQVCASARRENSEDSIEVLSTTDSIFPDDLTAITEEEAEQHLQSNGLQEGEGLRTRDGGDGSPGTSASWRGSGNQPTGLPSWDLLPGAALGSRLRVPEGHPAGGSSAPDPSCATLAEAARWTPPPPSAGGPLRQLSLDSDSDRTSLSASSDPPPSPDQPSWPGSGGRRGRGRRKAAAGALAFLRHNSFSLHAVFCLLSGRPLVVIGGEEGPVRSLVGALSLFLPAPGPDGSAVMPCLSSPLQLSDLLTWRLIGIHRSPSSAGVLHSLSRYSRYLGLLDLDQRTLQCPSYSGSLLPRLAPPQAGIRRGSTYLLHLESGLGALANRALLYTFCPELQRLSGGRGGGAGSVLGDHFLLARGCRGEDDLSVVHFLSDLIRRRHAGRGPPSLRFSYRSRQLHRNTQPP